MNKLHLNIRNFDLEGLILISLAIYFPFHLIEEGIFGFPAWAGKYWHLPNYTVKTWLLHNLFFVSALLLGYLIYRINKERFIAVGLGIVFWGTMNTLNHIGCSIAFLKYEPGILTSLLWIPIFKLSIDWLKENKKLSWRLMLTSFIIAVVVYWTLPIVSFIEMGFG